MKQAGKRLVAIATAAVAALAIGCQPGGETPPDDSEQSEAVALEVGRAVVNTGGAVATLAAPLAKALGDDGTTAATADGPLRQKIEAALAKLVAATECLSVDWSLLQATAHFDQCSLPQTNKTLDGSITVVVRPLKLQVVIRTDELSFGDETYYGTMTASLQGPLTAPTVSVDFDVTDADAATTLMVTDFRVATDLESVTIAGTGAVVSPKVDASATADAVRWNLGECAPSSGTIAYAQGQLSGVITFLPTTPSTGKVTLDIPRLPSQTIDMFPACQ